MKQKTEQELVDEFCQAVEEINAKNKADFEKTKEERVRKNDAQEQVPLRKDRK